MDVIEKGESLRHLDISGLPHLVDGSLTMITSYCKSLRELWMDDCVQLTNLAVIEAAYGLPELRSLHISSSIGILCAASLIYRYPTYLSIISNLPLTITNAYHTTPLPSYHYLLP